MKQKLHDCYPTITDNSYFLTNDNTIVTSKVCKEECVCPDKGECIRILELLESNKIAQAEQLFDTLQDEQAIRRKFFNTNIQY